MVEKEEKEFFLVKSYPKNIPPGRSLRRATVIHPPPLYTSFLVGLYLFSTFWAAQCWLVLKVVFTFTRRPNHPRPVSMLLFSRNHHHRSNSEKGVCEKDCQSVCVFSFFSFRACGGTGEWSRYSNGSARLPSLKPYILYSAS